MVLTIHSHQIVERLIKKNPGRDKNASYVSQFVWQRLHDYNYVHVILWDKVLILTQTEVWIFVFLRTRRIIIHLRVFSLFFPRNIPGPSVIKHDPTLLRPYAGRETEIEELERKVISPPFFSLPLLLLLLTRLTGRPLQVLRTQSSSQWLWQPWNRDGWE